MVRTSTDFVAVLELPVGKQSHFFFVFVFDTVDAIKSRAAHTTDATIII